MSCKWPVYNISIYANIIEAKSSPGYPSGRVMASSAGGSAWEPR